MTLPTTLSDHIATTPRDNAEQDHVEVFESRFADADDVDIEFFENEEARREEEYRRLKGPERLARHESDVEEAQRKAEELEAARQRQRLEDLSDEANKKIIASPKGPIKDKDGRTDLEYDDDGESRMKEATSRPRAIGVHASNPQQSSAETARSRRRKMLETELTESLRNNLLLERQRREQAKADAEGARDSISM